MSANRKPIPPGHEKPAGENKQRSRKAPRNLFLLVTDGLLRSLPAAPKHRYMSCGEKCPPRYECKQPEPCDHDKAIEEVREMNTPTLFTRGCHGNSKLWKNIFFFCCVPAIICAFVNAMVMGGEHRKRPKFIEFSHMRIRRKAYPWDPVRTFFHNPKVNALPTGYETEVPEEDEYDPFEPRC